jgi:hypothetical protein
MRRSRRRVVVSAATLLFGAACQSVVDSTPVERSAKPVALLQTSKAVTLVVGQATRIVAARSDGEWRTENPSVALVSADGTVSPTQRGVTRLIHRVESEVDTIAVTVREPVDSIRLGADLLNVRVGRRTKLAMRAFDGGSTVPATVDLNTKWTSTAPSIVAVDDNGVVSATGVGCAAVAVSVDAKVDTEMVVVTPASGALPASSARASCTSRIALRWTSVLPPSIQVGQTAQVSASPVDEGHGRPVEDDAVSYSTSDASIVDVTEAGTLRGVGAGDAVLTATSDGESISADISVLPVSGPRVGGVAVSLSRKQITVGDSVQAAAIAIATDGHPLLGLPVTWSVDPASAAVATVDGSGKVRSTGAGEAKIIATISGMNGSASITVDPGAIQVGQAPANPNPTGAAAVLALMGPTISPSQTPASFQWYESNFKKYADLQWAAYGPRWDAGNSNAGYDRAAINYVWWARTGDTTYLNRAHTTAVAYRDNFLAPAGFATSPHWSQVEGLYLDWLITGDTQSRDAVLRVANVFVAFDPFLDALYKDWLDNRIQARVLLSFWMAEKIEGVGSPWTARLNAAIPRVLSLQNADGHWGFLSTCDGSWNFMTGMLTDLLARMYDQRGDNGGNNPAILSSITKAANYLWDTQWRPADQSFNYASLVCRTDGGPTAAPDLNGLILPVYGFLGKKTGDASWFTKGDAILSGMTGAYIEAYKQFSESYTSSYRYFGYRFGQ